MIWIAVDAMGGDAAPRVAVDGALAAARFFGFAGALGSLGMNGDGVGWGSGDDGIEGNDGSIIPGPDHPVSWNSGCTSIDTLLLRWLSVRGRGL